MALGCGPIYRIPKFPLYGESIQSRATFAASFFLAGKEMLRT